MTKATPKLRDEAPTTEQLDQHFSAMDDSVQVIETRKADGPGPRQTQEQADAEIARNVEHLELMLEKDFIKNAGRDLAAYTAAVS
jgi:hypothetical protein